MKDILKKIGIALAMSAVTLASAQAAQRPATENITKKIEKMPNFYKPIATSSLKRNSLY